MNEFIFNGKSSKDYGLIVNTLPPIVKTPIRTEKIEIDGRNGDIINNLGYMAYDKEITVTRIDNNIDINSIIKWLNYSELGTLVLSNEPSLYYKAQIVEQIDFTRLENFEQVKIKFHVQPFKYKYPIEKAILPRGETSGANVKIENGKITKLVIEGKSVQETRSGKNLYNNDDTVATINAIIEKTEGGFVATRTVASSADVFVARYEKQLKPNTTYTLYENRTNDSTCYFYNDELFGNTLTRNLILARDDKIIYTFITDDSGKVVVGFYSANQTQGDIITLSNIMILEGEYSLENIPEYEEYGASPSHEFPSEIQSARGKNLLQNNATSTTINGITFTVNADGTVTANGTATGNAVLDIGRNLETTFKAGSYIASGCPSGGSSSSYQITVFKAVGATGETIGTDIGNGATIELSEESMVWLRIVIWAGQTVNNLTFKPMVEKGSIPTFYVPYNHIGIKSIGKNIFSYASMFWETSIYIYTKLKENTKYVLSMKLKEGKSIPSGLYVGFTEQGKYSDTQKIKWIISGGGYGAVEINNETRYMSNLVSGVYLPYLSVYPSSYASQLEDIFDIQLEYEMLTDYEEYKESIVTFPLAEGQKLYKDSYLSDDGIHNRRKQKVLDGTEYWSTLARQNTENTFYVASPVIDSIASKTNNNILCNIAKQGAVWNTDNANEVANVMMQATLRFRVSVNIANSVDSWKSYLAEQYANGTPVIIEYELAQEEIIPYTEEQQEAYNNLQNFELFEGVNNISNSADANMIIDYVDNKLTINNEGNHFSKPIFTITGSGIIEFIVNGNKLFSYTFPEGEDIVVIDSQKQDAYLGTILKNRNMAGEFPTLEIGENIITWNGNITNIEILSQSRWL